MNILIGYEGKCSRCEQTHRIYYVYADKVHKERMMDGSIMQEKSNCPICVNSKTLQTPHTMKWIRKLKPKEVEKDLQRQNGGVAIDFKAAEQQMKANEKNDIWLANNEQRIAEYQAWLKRTEGGIQKSTSRQRIT
jgi:hypothetical protein